MQNRIGGIILIVFVGAVLQAVLVAADCAESPHKTLSAFCKAYLNLDENTVDALTTKEARIKDGEDIVYNYMDKMRKMAADRGYSESFAKSSLKNPILYTVNKTEDEAEIRIAGKRIFLIDWLMRGKVESFDNTFKLVKQDGKWKVASGIAAIN